MTPRPLTCIVAAIAALAMVACDEYVPPGPDDGDVMPPGLVSVIGWDVTHVVVVFDEPVTRETADEPTNYNITEQVTPLAIGTGPMPLAPSSVFAASLHADNRTVTLTTIPLFDGGYAITVAGVSDLNGNEIVKVVDRPFDGNDELDTTPAEVVIQIPGPGARSIPTGTSVLVGFSEAVDFHTVIRGLDVIGEGAKVVSMRYDDLLRYTCDLEFLQTDTPYIISLSGIKDLAGNVMPDVQWTFETRATDDTVAPKVTSWRPGTLVNVDQGVDLSFTFSEPVDPYSLRVRPPVEFTAKRWSNGYRTVTYETVWDAGTQYTVQIRPGEMMDWSGNGSTQLFTLTFSTGPALEKGAFSGTIAGDPHSAAVSDARGGLVFAGLTSPYDLYTSVVAQVGANGAYELPNLDAGTYYPFYVKDTNGDHFYLPNYGDAIGIYGITNWQGNQDPLTVYVAQTKVPSINFQIYDPTAVYGLLNYGGFLAGPVTVGLFDTAGFDPWTSVPVMSILAEWNGAWDYVINTLDTGPIPDGQYYVAAYLDSDLDGAFTPAVDPIGVYGDASPIAVNLSNGRDAPNTSFVINDPSAPAATRAVAWPITRGSGRLQRFLEQTDVSARD